MNEANPNPPVSQEFREQWHKLCAIVMLKVGATEMEITAEDVERLVEECGHGGGIIADARGGRFVLRLADAGDVARLAREQGGSPS